MEAHAAAPWLPDRAELDLALALADEVFPGVELGGSLSLAASNAAAAALTTSSPLQSASPIDKEHARREKSREKERRRYYRNKGRMSDLQRQVESLECQLWALSSDVDVSASPSVASEKHGDAKEVSTPQARTQQLQLQLANAMRTKAQLRNENTQLRQKFRKESQRMELLADLLQSEHRLYIANSSYFRLLKPLTPRVCAVIQADCTAQVPVFTEELAIAAPLCGTLSGWKETRLVDGHLFKFSMKKTFHNMTPRLACSQQWAMLLDPTRHARLYSDVLNAELRFVQKVDEDNLVFYEQMLSMGPDNGTIVTKALILIARVKTARGYRIDLRGIDHDQVMIEDLLQDPEAQTPEIWNTSAMCVWIDFEEAADACVVTFAGMTPTAISDGKFWLTEIMLVCLRSVHKTIGTRFSLPD